MQASYMHEVYVWGLFNHPHFGWVRILFAMPTSFPIGMSTGVIGPRPNMQQSMVIAIRTDNEVRWPIVCFVFIYMMNLDSFGERLSQSLFSN